MANFTVSLNSGFIDPNGHPWSMRGLNAQAPDALAGFPNVLTDYPGLTAIRLAASSGGPFNPADSLATIQQIVQEYTARGVAVELELHYGNGYESNVAWYQQMAQAFKGNPLVFLETPNEPQAPMATTIQNQINIITAIRAAGFTNPIGLQPWGGYNPDNYAGVVAATGNVNIYATPHIYGVDWSMTAAQQARDNAGLFSVVDEFGDAVDGVHRDAGGTATIQGVIANNQAGKIGAIFWAMDNGNHPDGADSAFLTPDGSQLTSVGKMLQPWLSGGGTVTPPPVMPPLEPLGGVVTGTGSDALVLGISEDAYQGNAQFTVAVDGKQLGGTFTATALHGSNQTFTFNGDWAPGSHTVAVNFLNDAYGGTASTDRNLYVNSVTFDGMDTKQGATLFAQGAENFNVIDTTGGSTQLPPPSSVTTGSGSDTFVLGISEDAYQGDAKFTVAMDGNQLGGTFTATALHGSGASQSFIFKGDWSVGSHAISVNFLNDAYGGTTATDRNLYVDTVVYDGGDTKQSATMLAPGPKGFTVMDGTGPSVPPVTTHQLVLVLAEDRYQGDAQFIAKVDGKQVGTGAVTALEKSGQSQTFTFTGQWSPGSHDVEVDFTNDRYGGTPTTDRNLYVDAVKYDGASFLDHHVELYGNGAVHFTVGS